MAEREKKRRKGGGGGVSGTDSEKRKSVVGSPNSGVPVTHPGFSGPFPSNSARATTKRLASSLPDATTLLVGRTTLGTRRVCEEPGCCTRLRAASQKVVLLVVVVFSKLLLVGKLNNICPSLLLSSPFS